MKRILAVILILSNLILGTVVYASSYDYDFPIIISDTSGAARTYLPVMLGFNGQTLIDAGKMAANGLDTDYQVGGTSLKYMISTHNVTAVLPSLPANGKVDSNFYTGYSPAQTGFSIIPGYGGYVTVADAAALELGAAFQIDYSGYFNTANVENGYYKPESVYLGTNGGNIIAQIKGLGASSWVTPSIISSAGSWVNSTNAIDSNTATFAEEAPGGNSWTSFLELDLSGVGYVTASKIRYYADNLDGGDSIDVDVQDVLIGWTNVYEGAYTASAWEEQAIGSTIGISKIRVRFYNSGADAQKYLNEIQVESLAPETVTSAQSSGDYDVRVTYDGVNLKLYVDDMVTAADTEPCVGSVINNAGSWYIYPHPYTTYLKHTVGGTLISWYQPNTIISGETLPDREGAAQDGTITWGSNTGITIYYDTVTGSSTTTFARSSSGFEVPDASMPSTWYGTGSNIANLPFYSNFSDAATASGVPVHTIYFIIIIGLAFTALATVAGFTRSALLGMLAFNIVLFMGSSSTIIPMWIPFAILVVQLGIMYLYRQVSY